MPRKIRILFVIPTLDVGGAEMDLVHNAPRLDPARFHVVVCTLLRRGELSARLSEAGIEIVGPDIWPNQRKTPQRSLRSAIPDPIKRQMARFVRLLGIARARFVTVVAGLRRIMRPFAVFPRWLKRVSVRLLIQPLRDRWRQGAAGRSRRVRFLLGALPTHWYIFWRMSRPLVAYIRYAKIDVVHTILPNSYIVGGIACALTRRRLVMSRVSLNWYQDIHPVYKLLERVLMHHIVRVAIGNSRAILAELRDEGVAAHKLHLIHNGIPVGTFNKLMGSRSQARESLGLDPDALVFSVIGNLWPYKGHADLLAALALASAALPPDWVLLLVGRDIDGQRAVLEEICNRQDLAAHVRFLGERGDVPRLLRAADIHLSPSHTEGMPNNVLEAMCAGLPVIATNVGGIPELVVDDVTGILVPAANPPAMAKAILGLLANPARMAAMGAAARARVLESFSIEQSVACLERAYTALVPEAGV